MAVKFLRFSGIFILTLLSFSVANAQTFHYTSGTLDITIFASNPCNGSNNGFLRFTLNNATNGASGSASMFVNDPVDGNQAVPLNVGVPVIYNTAKNRTAGTYNFFLFDNVGSSSITSISNASPIVMMNLAPVVETDAGSTNLTNTSCSSPNGQIAFNIGGGSKALPGGGSFTYTITSSNSVVGFPLTGTYNGATTLDVVTLLNAGNPPITGLPGGNYSLSITDNYSVCGTSKNWTITDPSPIVFNTSAATPNVCVGQGGTIQLSGSETSAVSYEIYENGSPTGITQTGNSGLLNFTIPSALIPSVGSYNFTIRATNGFCNPVFMNLTAAIQVNALPVPTISGLTPVCVGTTGVSYVTESGKSVYTWTIVGGTITSGAGTNTVVVTWNTSGAESISVNYADANGCQAATPTTKTIAVNPLPVPTVTGAASVCIGSIGNAYNTETGKAGYLWTVTGGTITSGAGTSAIAVTWTTAGPQSVSVNYTDANTCTAASPTVKPITVNALPVPTIGGGASACLNTNTSYTTEVGNSSYVWTVSAGGTITAGAGTSSISVDWTATGVKTVTVTYVDANGCSPTTPTSKSVTVNPLPTPTITGPNAVCAGTIGSSYNTEVANSLYTWTVSAGGTITAGAGTSAITVTWNTAGPQTVTVNYTDVNGCTAAAPTSLPVTVNPLPVPTITGNAIVCVGTNGVSYATETGKSSYVWTVTGGVIATGTGTSAITVNWNTTGPQTITVNYSDINGCTAPTPTSLPITVNTLPVPTITGNLTACVNSTANVYTTESANSSYLWTVTGGTITAGAGTNSITVTWNTAGAQNVSVNYTNPNGCTAATPTTQPVTVNPPPVPTIGGTTSVCVGATGVTYTTEAGNSAYLWTITGGTITAGTGTNTITVDWTLAGSETLTVNYTDVNGCSAATPTSKTITVNPLPVPVITGSGTVCVNSVGNTYSTAAGNAGYTWAVSAGGTITSGAGTNIVSVTWNTAGPQTISVNYTDVNGCAAASPTSKPITVNSLPVPTITGAISACVGSTTNTYNTETGNSAYVWSVIGGTITAGAGTSSVTVTWTTPGSQSISVSYTDINGCTAATPVVQPVAVIAQPVPTITGTTSVCVGATGISYSTETGKSGYLWTVSGGTIASGTGTSSITVDWTASGSQTITVNYTDVSGCSAATPTSQSVLVNPLPVPTITGNNNVCINATGIPYLTETGKAGYIWSVTGGVIASGAGTNAITVNWNTIGGQTVTVTYVDANGCSPSAPTPLSVNVNNLPVPTITGAPAVCSGATGIPYTTEAGMTGYTWTVVNGVITAGAGTSSITVDWPTVGSGSLSVTYSDAATGCSAASPTVQPITINTTPDATINPAGPFCSNVVSVTLTSVTPGGTWSGTGITDVNLGTFSPSLAGPGSIGITYSLSSGGCNDVKSTTIVVNPAPDATITSSGPFCITDPPTNLAAATAGGTWSGTGITNAAAGTFDPAIGVGTYTITYTVTSGGCTDTKSASVTVGNPPDATITPVGPFCSNDPVITLTAATAGGTWTGPGITDPVNGVFDPSKAAIGLNSITYAIVIGGCSDTKSTTITINQAPDATITPQGTLCITDPAVTLVAATPGGIWSGTGITNTATGTFDPATATVGTYTITYSVTSGGCTDTKTTPITVGNPPDATITPVGPFCTSDAAVTLTAVTSGGTWSGTGITNASTGIFDPAIATAGTWTITYSVSVGGCSDSKTTSIVVNPGPDATITPVGPFQNCDLAITLTAATPGGSWSGAGITSAALGTFDPSTSGLGTFTITYTVTSGGCSATASTPITVSTCVIPPNNCGAFTAIITNTLPSCTAQNDGTITINVVGGTAPYIVTLARAGFVQALPGIGPNFNFVSLTPADYQYTIQDNAGNSCTLPYTLLVQTGVAVTASNMVDAVCFNGNGSATLTVTGGTSPYEYSVDAGVTWASFTSPAIINDIPSNTGNESILVRQNASDLCVTEVFVPITGPALSLDTLYIKKTISLPDLSTGTMLVGISEGSNLPDSAKLELITPVVSGEQFIQDWTKVNQNIENLKFEIKFIGLYAGVYALSIKDAAGCVKVYQVTIGLDTNIFIPNIFTPNGDGVNETFWIRNLPAGTTVVISNRWGAEVYSSKDYQNDWSAIGISDGIYYYRIKGGSDGQVFTGWLEVLRNQ